MIVGQFFLCNSFYNYSDGGCTKTLTHDHKPGEEAEMKRIRTAGGKIYQMKSKLQTNSKINSESNVLIGPYRVFPGHLSVSRTFGDPHAKLGKYGGNPHVVIATPEIFSFKVSNSYDFIAMGCDGIFDKLSSQDVVKCVWNTIAEEKTKELHQQCATAADSIIKNALLRHSLDNVTVVIIAFSHFKQITFPVNNHDAKLATKRKTNHNVGAICDKYIRKNIPIKIEKGEDLNNGNNLRLVECEKKVEISRSKLLLRLHG